MRVQVAPPLAGAFEPIAKGMKNAQMIGNGVSVYVAAGHYSESVVVVEGISLYGGHDPVTWVRQPSTNDTAILSQGPDGVYVGNLVTRKTVIDGFRLQGKDSAFTGSSNYGAALTIDGGTPTITGNVINGPAEASGARSIGVVVFGPSNDVTGALIQGNRITGGSGTAASQCEVSMGILLSSKTFPPPAPGAAAEVTRNQIRSGTCKNARAFVSFAHADQTRISDNDVVAGTATSGESFGMAVGGSPLNALIIIDKNRINVDPNTVGGCTPSAASALSWCGGIDSQAAKARIINNVVFGVKAMRSAAVWLRNPEVAPASLALNGNYLDGGGMMTASGSQSAAVAITLIFGQNGTVGRIRNNILVGGAGLVKFGVFEDSAVGKTCKPEKLENNDFVIDTNNNGNALYRTWDGALGTKLTTLPPVNMLNGSAANFQANPGVDATFHLISATSPCVDTGTASEAPTQDLDGEARPKGGGYDVGPDER